MPGKNKMSIAITGGSGYIGSSIARRLTSFDVRILDITPPKERTEGFIQFLECDVRDFKEVKDALRDVDLVIHAAIIQIPAINEQPRLGYEVNILGTQNVCRAIDDNPEIKGMILASSWHTIGEKGLKGKIDEEFGYRPDKVEDRARLYVLSKVAQESIVKFYDEMSDKVFGIIRMGTVLGKGMPEKTAANMFIERGLRGEPITPYKHSMYRPMLYVDLEDVCKAFKAFSEKILNDRISGGVSDHVINVFYPEPITILDLAEIVRDAIFKLSKSKIKPDVKIIDTGKASPFTERDKKLIKVDVSKALSLLELGKLKSPRESIEGIVKARLIGPQGGL